MLYSFCGQPDCTDGAYPSAGLIAVKGVLYGTTQSGGSLGDGTAFAIDPAARNRWMLLMGRALDEVDFPREAADLLREFFGSTATFLINRA